MTRSSSPVSIRRAGYQLTVDAHRYHPGITFPAGMLSSRVTLDWHFKADPAKSMVAPGLPDPRPAHRAEQPQPGRAEQHHDRRRERRARLPGPRPAVHHGDRQGRQGLVVRRRRQDLEGGHLRHSGSTWQATVHNPASGAVALRSEVTDAAGDRSVETVYRAYAIG
ncbi:putative protein OS=Streptomyces griseorubiginosus OX=67304 GN=AQJ54_08800 PE=4 SV=1 [Streptomyces griseorubiginosus]